MYKESSKISKINGSVFNGNKIYTHGLVAGTLQEFSLQGEVLWESVEVGVWDYNVYEDNIIFNLQKKNGVANDTYIYNKVSKKNWFHEKIVLSNISDDNYYKNNILYSFENGRVFLLNLSNGEIDMEISFNSKGIPLLITKALLVEKKKTSVFIYSILDFSFMWELDIISLFPNQEEVKIREVKEYNGSIIVVTTAGVLRLSAEDGSVIWKADGYARTMEIVDNIGYVCTGLSLLRINLDTGEESGYGWENHRLPDFTYKGKNYWPIGHKVVFHDGLLWYSVYSSGDSFLIAINPQNGNYEWIHYVDTNEKTDAPQFYGDKMFLRDTGNVLHIYEKE